ncbi:hypothetical protein, partial [Methylobacterium sp. UNC300MFChir4.1]|uniref:hypothetical protein n=1 Tax=Methylobacterium sp. UNC300MFChir4.1 TaxID=1502747 RepID=UPI001AECD54A
LNRSEKAWKMGPREWVMAKAQFAGIFGERFTLSAGVENTGSSAFRVARNARSGRGEGALA